MPALFDRRAMLGDAWRPFSSSFWYEGARWSTPLGAEYPRQCARGPSRTRSAGAFNLAARAGSGIAVWVCHCHTSARTGLAPAHICAGTGLAPAHICAGIRLARAHICTGTGLARAHVYTRLAPLLREGPGAADAGRYVYNTTAA